MDKFGLRLTRRGMHGKCARPRPLWVWVLACLLLLLFAVHGVSHHETGHDGVNSEPCGVCVSLAGFVLAFTVLALVEPETISPPSIHRVVGFPRRGETCLPSLRGPPHVFVSH